MVNPFLSSRLFWITGFCSIAYVQSSSGGEHHDRAAPPPPAQRRTHVTATELADLLATTAAAEAPVATPIVLPPLPDGVEELNFKDFYQMPVGPRGLVPSEKLLSMNGKRVRILGYMGRMERGDKRQMIFAAMPLQAQPDEYGLCDDVPATHVLVTVPGDSAEQVRFTPGALLLTGVLSVGVFAKEQETSFVRMQLDAPASIKTGEGK